MMGNNMSKFMEEQKLLDEITRLREEKEQILRDKITNLREAYDDLNERYYEQRKHFNLLLELIHTADTKEQFNKLKEVAKERIC